MAASSIKDLASGIMDDLPQPAGTVAALSENLSTLELCPIHGSWDAKVVDSEGVTRYLPMCPQCAVIDRAAAVLGRAGIPPRFQDRSVESFDAQTPQQKAAKAAASNFCRDFDGEVAKNGQCLVFIGLPGTGKTHLACGIAQALLAKRRSALYATVQDVILSVRDTWRDKSRSERGAYEAFNAVDLLILDEIGVQTGSEDEQRILYGVIGARHANLKPMILMSNLPVVSKDPAVRSFKDYIGARLFDRLQEGGGRTIVFDWPSHRRKV